ncbi:MAG: TIGR01777 family oxidoreductase [Rickettsiaceae bacterium]|nr:TIGR01777 family oxidoreductase [Rickettsiaceae bacterium]
MKILISGGTGLIGKELIRFFLNSSNCDIDILSRNTREKVLDIDKKISLKQSLSEEDEYDVIINLAGEPINKQRWNESFKKKLVSSRVDSTLRIIEYIKEARVKPKLLINASAIGFYGNDYNLSFDEYSEPIDPGFAHELCAEWEKAASKATEYIKRVCIIRIGIVLTNKGGALKDMIIPFKLGLGASLGNGRQYMSWIHIEDVCRAINFIIKNDNLSGIYNFTAPKPLTNQQFSDILASSLGMPRFFSIPASLINLIFGEMGREILLKSTKVLPKRLVEAGFIFNHENLARALDDIILNKS